MTVYPDPFKTTPVPPSDELRPDVSEAERAAVAEQAALYRRDFVSGRARPLTEYLPDAVEPRTALARLVQADLELRWASGQCWSLDDYCGRYPLLGPMTDLPIELICAAFRVAAEHGAAADLDEFCRRYPSRATEIRTHWWQHLAATMTGSGQEERTDLQTGDRIDDFELIALLGEGGFAKVFLARQVSLGRQVALKVAKTGGGEARTLASLDHDYIVRVFSESVLPERDLRLLCMQYVPGTTLGRIIGRLRAAGKTRWTGRDFLQVLDQLALQPTLFHPAALKDRLVLEQANQTEAVAWIGGRMAEALAYAHQQGVLHRDIKPDNILVNSFGRPLLADFNLALDTGRHDPEATFGGTLNYMAPEHLDAFDPEGPGGADQVRETADIYSLGVVLYELATGELPFTRPAGRTWGEALRQMRRDRGYPMPPVDAARADVSPALERVMRRCLAPVPEDRFSSAAQLSQSLDGTRRMEEIAAELPPIRGFALRGLRYPIAMFVGLAVLPHVVSSAVNISYNLSRIVSTLHPLQQEAFHTTILVYNLLAYPLCLVLLCSKALPVLATWRRLARHEDVSLDEARRARLRLANWGLWVVIVAGLGWLPGGLFFPWMIDLRAGSVDWDIYGHFLISFTLSGLIALTYSYFAVEWLALRVFYPQLLVDEPEPRQMAGREVGRLARRLPAFQILAGSIPLSAALLLLATQPPPVGGRDAFRWLVIALIFLGMLGFAIAVFAANYLDRTLAALTGRSTHSGPARQ